MSTIGSSAQTRGEDIVHHVKRLSLVIFVVFFIGLSVAPVAPQPAQAQAKSCPDMVTKALEIVNKQCAHTGRNKACYGNISVTAEAQPNTRGFKFEKPGDIVNVSTLKTVRLGELTVDNNTWGIAVLRIQANLPDSAPGQNVTMLLFGDVQITDGTKPSAPATPAATAATRTATPGAPIKYKPMQAFYFRAGVGEAACDEAPPDGILIQSPQGKQKIELTVDEARIVLGSTVFLQAQPGKELIVNTVEGSADVTAFGSTQTAVAGTRVRVPVDANLRASGPPSPPEPYDFTLINPLPVRILPRGISLAYPSNAVVTTWHLAEQTKTVGGDPSCRANPILPPSDVPLAMDISGKYLWLSGETFHQSSAGSYASDYASGNTSTHTEIHFASATHADITETGSLPPCVLNSTYTLDKLSPAATAAATGAPTAAPTP